MDKRPPLFVLSGPTATGKSALAVALAQRHGGEIISADSMQVYTTFDIASAKPTPDERGGVPHHLIDIIDPTDSFSVADYLPLAQAAIDDVAARGRIPILAGGTWLYISSLIDGLTLPPLPSDNALRSELEAQAAHDITVLVDYLRAHDPDAAARLHANDHKRIVRAVEVHRLTGVSLTQWGVRSRATPPRYDARIALLGYTQRERCYERINARVDAMLDAGLLEEARAQYDRRSSLSRTAMQAIGYKEFFAHFEGREPLDTAVETLKRETRRYAKRQITFMKAHENAVWIMRDDTPPHELAQRVADIWQM